jgi:hypothetical protein
VFHPGSTMDEIAGYIREITPGIRAKRLTA